MTIGTPWGETFDSSSEHLLSRYGQSSENSSVPITAHIDREHDVPLLAASLIHPETGEHYGTAVDRRIPHYATIDGITFDPAQFVDRHEKKETDEMMSKGTSYQEAHDKIATPHEKALVQTFAKENKKDPTSFWNKYQSWWSGHSKTTMAQDPEKVHPHTWLEPYKQSNPELYEKMKGIQDKVDETVKSINRSSPSEIVNDPINTAMFLMGPGVRMGGKMPTPTVANLNESLHELGSKVATFYDRNPIEVTKILESGRNWADSLKQKGIKMTEALQDRITSMVRQEVKELPTFSKHGRALETQQKRSQIKVDKINPNEGKNSNLYEELDDETFKRWFGKSKAEMRREDFKVIKGEKQDE